MNTSEISAGTLGPFTGPSTTTWRRHRLLRIGSLSSVQSQPEADENPPLDPHLNQTVDESSALQTTNNASYGSTPSRPRPRAIASLPHRFSDVSLRGTGFFPSSSPASPVLRSPSYFRSINERPISAYDEAPGFRSDNLDRDTAVDAKINGVRVWYSSFTSIDWLHDAIKDSVRFSRLRKRDSIRARIRLIIDKSLGWWIVTIVGFLSAVVAFLIVRSEQRLFDLKEGYCRDSLWKAKRFCCPEQAEGSDFTAARGPEECDSWRTWVQILGPSMQHGGWIDVEQEIIEYVAYAVVALTLALLSCLLTIGLTASTSFSTRKESGVLSPDWVVHTDKDTPVPTTSIKSKRKVMHYAAGSGIPEVKTILSGFVIHGYLGGRTLFTKAVGLSLSVASGLSLGKEGPMVHIACCIGNIVSRFTRKYENNEAKRREILSAACAAGVAVAFGAPIGGTLFSLEEVSYFFPNKVMWRSFFCAMIAAITLKFLDPFGTGKLVLFQVTYDRDWHAYELGAFLVLGVFGGVYGAFFSKLNFRWSRNVRNGTWLKSHPVAEVLAVTLATTALCFLNPYTRMGGTELVYNLFAECRPGYNHSGLCVVDPSSLEQVLPVLRAILVAMVVKGVLTIVTFGIKVPAGIFVPTLGVGACAGRIMGLVMQWLQLNYPEKSIFRVCRGDKNCVVPGLYAMVGAAATLSGVTRTTVSLAVIMFELTDTLTYVVPVMLAVLVAKTVADALETKGIYDLVIELTQLPYLDAKHEYLWANLKIEDVVGRNVDTIQVYQRNTVRSLRDKLQVYLCSGSDDGGFPIVRKGDDDDRSRMIGYIGANELEHALSIVADDPEDEIYFHTNYDRRDLNSSSLSSLLEAQDGLNPFDFSVYMDQAPLTVQSNSPLELVHQFFVKLGARYVVVTDADGHYEGVIDKKTWLAFLSGLEERS